MEKLKAGEIDKQQLTDKEQVAMEEAALQSEQGLQPEQQQKGLLAKSLQEEGEEELYKIKQISAQDEPQPMADDDSDMADITREKFTEDDRYASKSNIETSAETYFNFIELISFVTTTHQTRCFFHHSVFLIICYRKPAKHTCIFCIALGLSL